MTRTVTNPGFSPKDPSEIVTLAFDFEALVAIPLSPVVTSARHAGAADASPSAILHGDPVVVGSQVRQQVKLGTDGTDYLLRAQADDADGNRFILAGILPVRTA